MANVVVAALIRQCADEIQYFLFRCEHGLAMALNWAAQCWSIHFTLNATAGQMQEE
jgi:hypothetical protein